MLKWPDAQTVAEAVKRWAEKVVQERPEVVQIGYFGSYARGDWGVGSDLDLVIILEHTNTPFAMRPSEWDTFALPVPTDVLVYTRDEWDTLSTQRQFFQNLANETVWVYPRLPLEG